jgi:non-ribosomal peptide synthetase component F
MSFERWLAYVDGQPFQRDPVDDLALIPGTGGTTGKPIRRCANGENLANFTASSATQCKSNPVSGRSLSKTVASPASR